MKVVLNLDDFTPVQNRFDLLYRLKDYFPDFKVSMFTIPIDKKMDYGPYCIRPQLLEEVKRNLDWLQIIPHGLTHSSSWELREMSYEDFKFKTLPSVIRSFELDGLPFVKGFKAPHWKWSEGVVKVLDEEGWWGAVLREGGMPTPKRSYVYTHLLNEPFWESDVEVLKLHGHMYGTKNDLGLCFDNLLKLPRETQFSYVTDFIDEAV